MNERRRAMIEAACDIARRDDAAPRVIKPYRGIYRRLHRETETGKVVGGQSIAFATPDRQILRHWLRSKGIDPDIGIPSGARGRSDLAGFQTDEKAGAEAIAAHRVLLALAPAGDGPAGINSRAFTVPSGGFLVLPQAVISRVECDWILTVENFETFLALCAKPNRLGRAGRGVLVMRTSPSFPAGMRWVRKLARTEGISHWHAPDLDPQGLSHCLESPIAGAWLPRLEAITLNVRRSTDLYDHQQFIVQGLKERAAERFPALARWIDWVCEAQSGVTQEAAFAADIPFEWVVNARTMPRA